MFRDALERFYRWLEGPTYRPPTTERGSRTQQAHPVPVPRSSGAVNVHYHDWDPSEACVTNHMTLNDRRKAPREERCLRFYDHELGIIHGCNGVERRGR
jgi:hypothetical protein